jgi:hypothetical protein
MLADYYGSCLGPASSETACGQNWGAGEDIAHATCAECLVTPGTSVTWGPLVSFGTAGIVSVNVAGCIELLDPADVACATPVQAELECEHEACESACPGPVQFPSCVAAADEGACASYAHGATCTLAEADGGAAASCVAGATFEDLFLVAAKVFCGGD